ncbi:ketopantoate reductase family protein [Streptomyces chartreusis]|uniref:ketopantoate reductase family protein n=1 Tax=Streptomyces chartreusis TaxID=1969 RepID=UPI0036AE29DB
MSSPKIAVLGAGANGASVGADLTEAGLDVVLIEQWPAHVEAMRSRGVRINEADRSRTVPVRTIHLCEAATLHERFDHVLMLVKAYDSRWAAHLIEPYLKPDGLLVGVQNGMTVDTIADVVGASRTLGGVIEITSAMFEPGIVERYAPVERSWFAVGSLGPETKGREEEIAALLRHSGAVDIVDDIRATKWMKLVVNATALVTTAILGLPLAEAAEIPKMRSFMIRSGQEALDAAVALGNPVLPIFGMSQETLGGPGGQVSNLLDTLLSQFVVPGGKTTVLQDWIKGRRSEAEDIHGLVAATHRDIGRRAPANEAVVELARRIERGELEPQVGNLDLLLELGNG